jgi:competence protein ComEC
MRVRVVRFAVCCFAIWSSLFALRAKSEWDELRHVSGFDFSGVAKLVTDPEPGQSTRVIFEIRGKRFVAYLYGSNAGRVSRALAGESVYLRGRTTPGAPSYLAARHVVGRIEVANIDERVHAGSPLARSANNVRRAITEGAGSMSPANAALFTGLVIGDDRNQSQAMIADFRKAGMSHLTAVSGQNVAFILSVFAPLLVRLAPRRRMAATLLIVGWFVLLTRAEPSVLRAAGMSMISAHGYMRGQRVRTVGALAACVSVLLLVDPLLAWSPGWWLSVSASLGICTLAKPIADRIPGNRIAELLAATLAAQIATLPVSLLYFGQLAPLGLFANVLTVPVAGLVMLVGFPLGLVAGLGPESIASIVMYPVEIAVAWIALVARLFSL